MLELARWVLGTFFSFGLSYVIYVSIEKINLLVETEIVEMEYTFFHDSPKRIISLIAGMGVFVKNY